MNLTPSPAGPIDERKAKEETAQTALPAGAPEEALNWFEVRTAPALLDHLQLGNAVRVLRLKLGFPAEMFATGAQPLVHAFAEFVQELPSPGNGLTPMASSHLATALARTLRALDRRRGQILPRGAAPEDIGELTHRWTYAVMVAALLNQLRSVFDGVRVRIQDGDGSIRSWTPGQGSMREAGAVRYAVEALAGGHWTDEEPEFAWHCCERWMPLLVRAWLGEDHRLLSELRAFLIGQSQGKGVFDELVFAKWPMAATRSGPAANQPPVPAELTETDGANTSNAADGAAAVATPADTIESLDPVTPGRSGVAAEFMAWLGQGIESGALTVNQAGALVHGVDQGLLLVSPGTFRRFAKQTAASEEPADDAAMTVQREVLRQGWHVRTARGVSMVCFERARKDKAAIRMHGIVIRDPRRFVRNMPPVDPELTQVVATGLGGGESPV